MRLLSLLLLLAGPAAAEGLPSFDFTGIAALRRAFERSAPQPAPQAKAADVVTQRHMHIQAGREVLFGYADDEAQLVEAVSFWNAALRSAGIEPGPATFKDGMFTIPYKTADGRVLRGFMADAKQFPPKDEAGLRENMALARKTLSETGLTPVSAQVLKLQYILPTYSLLYLTKPEADPSKETRLRILNSRDEADFAVFADAGVRIMQIPKPWLMVYVGPEAGYVSMIAQDLPNAERKLAERRQALTQAGKRIVAERIAPIDMDKWKYAVSLYFFH